MRTLDANAPMDYQEYAVPQALSGHVAAVWHLRDPQVTQEIQTIYPDGCCELIAHLATRPECQEMQGWRVQSATLFAGQRLGAVRLRRAGPLDCVGVRLRPEASAALGTQLLRRTRERIVDLAGIDAALSRKLRQAARAFAAGDASRLWKLLSRTIASHVVDVAAALAVQRIAQSGGQMRIAAVAHAAGLGPRSLQARFRRAVGLTPKEFSRLVRLQATLRSLDEGDGRLSELAAERGFSDQAHAARELRRVTGLAPSRLRVALRADRHGDTAIRLAAAFVRGQAPSG
jgi:AraC-like DNA-binding protein